MSNIILVTGGARSGKSTYAEKLAENSGLDVTYIATAEVKDEEMERRIKSHRQRRPENWITIEAPLDLKEALAGQVDFKQFILLDCVTVYLSNKLINCWQEWGKKEEEKIIEEFEILGEMIKDGRAAVTFVSNEVGLGLVPDNEMGRAFRDIAGKVNQVIANFSTEVYFVVAGIPKRFK